MWWTLDRNLTLNDTYLSAMATYIDSIKNGVTTVFDHHASFGAIKGSLFEIERAAKETGIRSCLCYEVSDRDGKDKARESVMENAEFIRHALKDDSGMIAGMMGMHAQFTISDETMELAAANKPDEVGYHIHVAEGIEDLLSVKAGFPMPCLSGIQSPSVGKTITIACSKKIPNFLEIRASSVKAATVSDMHLSRFRIPACIPFTAENNATFGMPLRKWAQKRSSFCLD